MSASASTFESHLQLAHEPLARRFVVLLEAFHLLAVEVGKALTTSMRFDSRSKSATREKNTRMEVAFAVAVKVVSK
eukprot:6211855-Pleurochrysis_carterae.AAC.1